MKILNKIQKDLNVPKNQYNSFGKFKYRSCEDILASVKPLLGDATLTLSDDIIQVGERIYVKATATIKAGEESESVSAYAREDENKKGMDLAQLTGSCSSYARKYALNGLFLLDDVKDADTRDNRNTTQAPKQGTTATKQKEAPLTQPEPAKTEEDIEKNLMIRKMRDAKKTNPDLFGIVWVNLKLGDKIPKDLSLDQCKQFMKEFVKRS